MVGYNSSPSRETRIIDLGREYYLLRAFGWLSIQHIFINIKIIRDKGFHSFWGHSIVTEIKIKNIFCVKWVQN